MSGYENPQYKHRTEHQLSTDGYLSIPLDAPALERRTHDDGTEYEVLARMRKVSGHSTYRDHEPAPNLLLVRNEKGDVSFEAVDQHDRFISDRSARVAAPVHYRTRKTDIVTDTGAPKIDFVFTRPHDKEAAPVINISRLQGLNSILKITTAKDVGEESFRERTLDSLARLNGEHRKQKRHKWLTRLVLAGVLASGTNATGGPYDVLKDSLSDAGKVVEETFPAKNAEQKAAVEHVARTMQDLDDQNLVAITVRSQRFEAENKDKLFSHEEVEEFYERLDAAHSNDDIVHVADDFMHIFGKTAQLDTNPARTPEIAAFDPSTDVNLMRDYARGVIDAYSFMPKDLVEKAHFSTLTFGSPFAGEAPSLNGLYSSNNKVIRLVVREPVAGSGRDNAAEIANHENHHAVDDESSPHGSTGKELSAGEWLQYILDGLTDQNEDVSEYAAANGRGEKDAEVAASLLTRGHKNKLAHPDDARQFESGANKQMIKQLIKWDEKYPGISDYIVNHVGTGQRTGAWFVFWR